MRTNAVAITRRRSRLVASTLGFMPDADGVDMLARMRDRDLAAKIAHVDWLAGTLAVMRRLREAAESGGPEDVAAAVARLMDITIAGRDFWYARTPGGGRMHAVNPNPPSKFMRTVAAAPRTHIVIRGRRWLKVTTAARPRSAPIALVDSRDGAIHDPTSDGRPGRLRYSHRELAHVAVDGVEASDGPDGPYVKSLGMDVEELEYWSLGRILHDDPLFREWRRANGADY